MTNEQLLCLVMDIKGSKESGAKMIARDLSDLAYGARYRSNESRAQLVFDLASTYRVEFPAVAAMMIDAATKGSIHA